MVILGAVMPGQVGRWWMWLLVLVGIAAWVWRAMGEGSIVIQLLDDGGALRLSVKGQSVEIDEEVAPGYEHWCELQRVPVGMGGGHMAHFSLQVRTKGGRTLGFRQMGGNDAAGWPTRKGRLPDGPDVFTTVNILGLQHVLAERQAAAAAGS